MSSSAISVVTPFYNTATYLAECIESVLRQTRGDFEFILQDNCSTDESLEIAESYARRDPRIRVFRNTTLLSQVQNYNLALEQVSDDAQFVKIVQADDWIFPNCLAEMTALAERHPSIGLVSAYEIRGTRPRGRGLLPHQTVLAGRDICRLFFTEGIYLFGSPTTVMYRADIVRNRRPFYAEGRYHEDTEAVFEILESSDFGFVHQILSYLREQPGSITSGVRNLDPEALDLLVTITRFGRRFLDNPEYARCYREARRDYYRCLAAAWLRRAAPAYWDYHRAGLATIDETIDRRELTRQVVAEMASQAVPHAFHGGWFRPALLRAQRRLGLGRD